MDIYPQHTSIAQGKGNDFIADVMPRFSVEQIESIVFDQVGDYPKKLKHIKDPHPMMNAHGLIRIDGEYYQWVYSNGA